MSNLSSYQYTHVPVPNDSTTSSGNGNGGRGGRPYPSVSFSEEDDDDENEHGHFSMYHPNRQSVPHVLGRRQPYLIAGVVFLFLILVTHQGGGRHKDDAAPVSSGDDDVDVAKVDTEPITTTNADDDGAVAAAATTTTTKTSEAEDTKVVEEDDASAEEEDGDVQAAADTDKQVENQTDIATTFATYTEDPNLNVPYPRLSLLFGYPQSGLSYTVSAIQSFSSSSGGGANHNPTASGTTATNYGTNANLDDFGRNYLVYDDSPSGPYWLHEPHQPTTEKGTKGKQQQGDIRKYVVTETRCGGHCTYCPPSSYLLKYDDFDTECRTTTHYDENNPDTIVQSVYNDTRIARALHLIRDPLSNIVSRFHAEHLHRKNRHDNTWLAKFPNNKNGFQSWCSEVNGMYGSQDRVNYFSGETLKAMDKVPCVDEFVRYGKWHSHVIEFIQKHKLPSLVLRYDHLGDDATKEIWSDLVTFLNLPKNKEKVNTLDQFHGGKVYGKTHYTEEQRSSIWKLLKLVMNTKGWELIQPYQEKNE